MTVTIALWVDKGQSREPGQIMSPQAEELTIGLNGLGEEGKGEKGVRDDPQVSFNSRLHCSIGLFFYIHLEDFMVTESFFPKPFKSSFTPSHIFQNPVFLFSSPF